MLCPISRIQKQTKPRMSKRQHLFCSFNYMIADSVRLSKIAISDYISSHHGGVLVKVFN